MEHTNYQSTNDDDIILCKGPIELESNETINLVNLTLDQAKEEITKLNKEIFMLKRKLEEKNEGNIKAIYY